MKIDSKEWKRLIDTLQKAGADLIFHVEDGTMKLGKKEDNYGLVGASGVMAFNLTKEHTDLPDGNYHFRTEDLKIALSPMKGKIEMKVNKDGIMKLVDDSFEETNELKILFGEVKDE